VTLSGTVDDQFQEWRRILGEMFILQEGEAPLQTDQSSEAKL